MQGHSVVSPTIVGVAFGREPTRAAAAGLPGARRRLVCAGIRGRPEGASTDGERLDARDDRDRDGARQHAAADDVRSDDRATSPVGEHTCPDDEPDGRRAHVADHPREDADRHQRVTAAFRAH